MKAYGDIEAVNLNTGESYVRVTGNGASNMATVSGHATVEVVPVKEFSPPKAGELLMCLVCAYEKPWGVFDSKTGASVCVECRDKARQ